MGLSFGQLTNWALVNLENNLSFKWSNIDYVAMAFVIEYDLKLKMDWIIHWLMDCIEVGAVTWLSKGEDLGEGNIAYIH